MSVKTLGATLKAKYADAIALAIAFLDQLKSDADRLDSTVLAHETVLAELITANSDISDAAAALKAGFPTVTVGGIIYDLILPEVVYNGATITAEYIDGLGNDSALATSLVATESNMVRIHKPTANFTADDVTVEPDDDVTFTDSSTNEPASWAWDFGDGETSEEQNPVHAYAEDGTYTVILIAANAGGSDTKTRTNYITVATPGP